MTKTDAHFLSFHILEIQVTINDIDRSFSMDFKEQESYENDQVIIHK